MLKSKVSRIVLVLNLAILIFVGLLIYLNIFLFKLRKEKIELQSRNLISEAFFSIPFKTKDLSNYVDELISQQQTKPNDVVSRLKKIYNNHSQISSKIDTLFSRVGLTSKYNWTVSVPRFEVRNLDKTTFLIDSKNKSSQELVLYGREEISVNSFKYVFYKTGNNYFIQINLYVDFLNLYADIGRQLKYVLLIDVLLVVFFVFLMGYSMKILIRQNKMVNFQKDLLNAVSHEFNTPLSSIQIGGQMLMKLEEQKNFTTINDIASRILRQQI